MKKIQPLVGGICQSIQGRDEGKFYIIKEVLPNGYVLVADGDCKKLAEPKKKSVKHLHLLPDRAEVIAEKLAGGAKVFDSEVYSALKAFKAEKDGE